MKRTLVTTGVLALALAGSTVLASADTATPARSGAYVVVAKVNKTDPLVGGTVTIRGDVTPAAPGAAVTLQVRYEDQKTWKTIDRGRLNGQGKVTFKDKIGSPRWRKYRVVKPADSHGGAGSGQTPKVSVYSWSDLTSLKAATGNMQANTEVTINGKAFPASIRSYSYPYGSSSSIDYNLGRHCKTFRATVGLDDSSPTNGTTHIQVGTDGLLRYSGDFALTQSAPVSFGVSGVFRLNFFASVTNGGLAAIGSPQVLCSF